MLSSLSILIFTAFLAISNTCLAGQGVYIPLSDSYCNALLEQMPKRESAKAFNAHHYGSLLLEVSLFRDIDSALKPFDVLYQKTFGKDFKLSRSYFLAMVMKDNAARLILSLNKKKLNETVLKLDGPINEENGIQLDILLMRQGGWLSGISLETVQILLIHYGIVPEAKNASHSYAESFKDLLEIDWEIKNEVLKAAEKKSTATEEIDRIVREEFDDLKEFNFKRKKYTPKKLTEKLFKINFEVFSLKKNTIPLGIAKISERAEQKTGNVSAFVRLKSNLILPRTAHVERLVKDRFGDIQSWVIDTGTSVSGKQNKIEVPDTWMRANLEKIEIISD